MKVDTHEECVFHLPALQFLPSINDSVSTAMPSLEAGPKAPTPIAIIGLACRLPGDASDPINLWNMMKAAKCESIGDSCCC